MEVKVLLCPPKITASAGFCSLRQTFADLTMWKIFGDYGIYLLK